MKNRKIVIAIVAVCLLAAGALSYLYYGGLWEKIAASAGSARETEITAPGHQQHGAAPVATEPKGDAESAAAGEAEAPTVEILEDLQRLIGVKTVKAVVKPLEKVIRTVGRIEYDERKLATANTKIEGWIEKLHVDYTGRYVKQGEPLAEIYSPELVATQKEYLNALQWASQSPNVKDERVSMLLAKDAEAILAATRERLRLWDISDEQIDEIAATGKPVRTLTIYSPVNGYITQKMAIQGMRVMPGEKLFDVVDLSEVWVLADIYEYELPLIKVGQKALIGISYFPGREFNSRVDYIYPSLDGNTRTAKARFTISNPGGALKPQMFTNVEIKADLGRKLVVPAESVIDTGERKVIYVDKGEGNFEPREVLTGLRAEGMVEIIRGLKADEKVAAAANFLIDSEAKLRGVAPLPMRLK